MSSQERCTELEEEVANTLVQRQHGAWSAEEQRALEQRLASDAAYAEAYRLAEQSLGALHASAEMPEMMRFRQEAIAHARRAGVRRWLGPDAGGGTRLWLKVAGVASLAVALATAWQFSPWSFGQEQYRTGIGEQRIVELEDHSRVVLDAATRVAIDYSDESRTLRLLDGQAQFSVAKDPARPFRVHVGDRIVVALGTTFTVDYTDGKIRVAMVEGRVAVVPRVARGDSGVAPSLLTAPSGTNERVGETAREDQAVELSAGQELKVARNGQSTVIPVADLEAATAWRHGKVVFRSERLGEAVQRINRYSRLQLQIADPALAEEPVSGVFEAGDTQGFIAAVQLALPVAVSHRDANTIALTFAPGSEMSGAEMERP